MGQISYLKNALSVCPSVQQKKVGLWGRVDWGPLVDWGAKSGLGGHVDWGGTRGLGGRVDWGTKVATAGPGGRRPPPEVGGAKRS
jgi:hypothetical protein